MSTSVHRSATVQIRRSRLVALVVGSQPWRQSSTWAVTAFAFEGNGRPRPRDLAGGRPGYIPYSGPHPATATDVPGPGTPASAPAGHAGARVDHVPDTRGLAAKRSAPATPSRPRRRARRGVGPGVDEPADAASTRRGS